MPGLSVSGVRPIAQASAYVAACSRRRRQCAVIVTAQGAMHQPRACSGTGTSCGMRSRTQLAAVIAAQCLVEHEAAPKTAANCVRERMPHDVPVPEHARG